MGGGASDRVNGGFRGGRQTRSIGRDWKSVRNGIRDSRINPTVRSEVPSTFRSRGMHTISQVDKPKIFREFPFQARIGFGVV